MDHEVVWHWRGLTQLHPKRPTCDVRQGRTFAGLGPGLVAVRQVVSRQTGATRQRQHLQAHQSRSSRRLILRTAGHPVQAGIHGPAGDLLRHQARCRRVARSRTQARCGGPDSRVGSQAHPAWRNDAVETVAPMVAAHSTPASLVSNPVWAPDSSASTSRARTEARKWSYAIAATFLPKQYWVRAVGCQPVCRRRRRAGSVIAASGRVIALCRDSADDSVLGDPDLGGCLRGCLGRVGCIGRDFCLGGHLNRRVYRCCAVRSA